MPMKFHEAKDTGAVFHFCIHLDDTKVDENGAPLPEWCVEYPYGKAEPQKEDETAAAYAARVKAHWDMIMREVKLLAAEELAKRTAAATSLAVEGSAL